MRSGRPILQFTNRPEILDLGWGHPRPDLLPTDRWLDAVGETTRAYGWQAMAYGNAAGPGPLIAWLSARLGVIDGGPCRPSEVFITGGASHALALTSHLLTTPGDVVLVDSPTYHLAFRTILDHGVDLVGVPTDNDGPDPAGLADLIRALRRGGRRVPMLYLVATFGNPTGRSVSDARRVELVDLARRLELTIVEDDTYRELVYDGVAPRSLWDLARHEFLIRIGSFAKTVAPGLRLGWINASEDLVRRLERLGYVASGGGVNHTTAITMAAFGASGDYDEHLADLRRQYARQRDALVAALTDPSASNQVPVPAGGWFLWWELPHGVTARALLPAAERHGVSFVEGDRFYVDRSSGGTHVRLSFSMLPSAQLKEAGRRLRHAIEEIDR